MWIELAEVSGLIFGQVLKKVTARKGFSRGFAARVFGLRSKTGRPAVDEALRRAREKNLWYPG